jgi:flagellar M-ring protein FliF
MLGVVVGPEKITTQISADIDFNQTEQTEEIFDPDSQVIRSEKIDEESNIGVKPWKSLKANENINYEINKITRRTISPVGKIKQLSIAVMVDGTYDKTNKYVPRNAIEMLQYGRIVERAVGYDEERGDKIEVVNIPFNGALIKDEKKTVDKSTKWGFEVPMVFWAVTLIFILILLALLIKSLIAWIRVAGAKKPKESSPPSPKDAEEEVVEQAEKIVSAPIKEDFRKAVQDYARKEPTHTAELMRKWLKHKR